MSKKSVYYSKIKNNPRFTLFQKKILLEVLNIPKGETRSYAWIAGKAGFPKACRAVGEVMRRNPYAPHVPCHRVISSNGRIGGYSKGVLQKRVLLRKEGVILTYVKIGRY